MALQRTGSTIQQARLSPKPPSKTDEKRYDSGLGPMSPSSLAKADKGQPSSPFLGKTGDSGDPGYENVYSGFVQVPPSNLAEATSLARRMCQKARKPCSIAFTTKRTVTEGGNAAYKLWGPCAECKPGCSFHARVVVWISGPAEGKVTVDCRGQHDRKALAQGGRLLSAEVQDVVNDHVDSGAPITSRSLREALRRAGLEFSCDSSQLHSPVKRLRQKHGTVSSTKPVPIEAFLDEVKSWQADVPEDLESAGDLSQLLVLKSPNGVVVEEGRVYVPLSCAGMLLRLKDAAKHRIRLIVDMKMGAIANNYGVVTLCLAARSLPPSNTNAAMIAGKRQQYKAHTSNAQPIMQAIVNSESEENLTAVFEDLCWLCKEIANFDLKSQLVQVHADYAPGIAAARRAVFPGARLVGDYFHYKQALARNLPRKFAQSAKKAPGRKKPDPAVANVMTLSDMTRLLQPAVHIEFA